MKITKEAALVFLLLAITYAYFYQIPTANGDTRLALTMALVKEGRVNTDTFNSDAGGYKSIDISSYQGKYYTDKAIGSSVLGALVYAPIYYTLRLFGQTLSLDVEKHLLTFLVIGLLSALAGTMIYMLCEYISQSRFKAFIVTIAIALGTMCFPFSLIYFGHQLAAALVFAGFFMIFLIRTLPEPAKVTRLHFFAIGMLLGLALLTDMTTAVIVLPLALYYLYVLWTRKLLKQAAAWVIPTLGGLIPMLVMVAYNMAAYGKPLASGYQYLVDETNRAAMAKGIMGIGRPSLHVLFFETIHPAQGIFWQAPVLLMAFVGGIAMLRKKQVWAELAVTAIACAAYLLLNAGYFMWWGGWSFTPRQVIPMLPFLCLPLIFVPKKAFPVMIVLTAISVLQMGIVAASKIVVPDDYMLQIFHLKFFQYSIIYSGCLKELFAGRFAWNIGNAWFGLQGWASLIPICLLVLATTLFFACTKSAPKDKQMPSGNLFPNGQPSSANLALGSKAG
jgi:hypothetical protein